jgi:uncharacterized membrane protein (UPF0127 family)
MQHVLIHNLSQTQAQPVSARYCASFFCQLRGLMFRRSLPPGEGLLLVQQRDTRLESSIHMLFMRIDLAVVWINSAGEVVDVRLARRWRPAYFPRRPACYILEANTARLDDFKVGDRVRFEEVENPAALAAAIRDD